MFDLLQLLLDRLLLHQVALEHFLVLLDLLLLLLGVLIPQLRDFSFGLLSQIGEAAVDLLLDLLVLVQVLRDPDKPVVVRMALQL